MTSVKEFDIERSPTAEELGAGRFVFTDAYSIFDWGEMPDHIPGKGQSLCTMGAASFEALEDSGISTHYRGVSVDGEPAVSLDALETPPREMAIALTQVPALPQQNDGYDYDAYHGAAGENYLIPLEIVFRNRVPLGSSLRRRRDPRSVGLDRDSWPEAPVSLPEPLIEFSTKYESKDRYLDRNEAANIAGAASIEALESTARAVNRVVTDLAEKRGLRHEDGKIECCYHRGDIIVADVVGTFDENRFSFEGYPLSKEAIRSYHRRHQAEWVTALEQAKKATPTGGDWKANCSLAPDPLPSEVVTAMSDLYTAGANRYIDRSLFEVLSIEQAVERARSILGEP